MNSTSLRQLFRFRTPIRRLLFCFIVVGGLLCLGTQALAQRQTSQPDGPSTQTDQAAYVTVKNWFDQLIQNQPEMLSSEPEPEPEPGRPAPTSSQQTLFDTITALTDDMAQINK